MVIMVSSFFMFASFLTILAIKIAGIILMIFTIIAICMVLIMDTICMVISPEGG